MEDNHATATPLHADNIYTQIKAEALLQVGIQFDNKPFAAPLRDNQNNKYVKMIC